MRTEYPLKTKKQKKVKKIITLIIKLLKQRKILKKVNIHLSQNYIKEI